jgi:hypothetical protein
MSDKSVDFHARLGEVLAKIAQAPSPSKALLTVPSGAITMCQLLPRIQQCPNSCLMERRPPNLNQEHEMGQAVTRHRLTSSEIGKGRALQR